MIEPLLAIRDLRVTFAADEGEVEAVAGVSSTSRPTAPWRLSAKAARARP